MPDDPCIYTHSPRAEPLLVLTVTMASSPGARPPIVISIQTSAFTTFSLTTGGGGTKHTVTAGDE